MVELPRLDTVTVWTSLLIILPGIAVHGQRRVQDSAASRIRRLASRGRDHHSFVPYLRATPGQRAMRLTCGKLVTENGKLPDTPRGRGRPGRWCGLSSRAGRHHPLLSTARL